MRIVVLHGHGSSGVHGASTPDGRLNDDYLHGEAGRALADGADVVLATWCGDLYVLEAPEGTTVEALVKPRSTKVPELRAARTPEEEIATWPEKFGRPKTGPEEVTT